MQGSLPDQLQPESLVLIASPVHILIPIGLFFSPKKRRNVEISLLLEAMLL